MPDFRMWDPWVTREMTIRDLLVHRSGLGLGEGDLLFLPNSTLSRKETVRRIRYLKPATSFRSGYAYDNILYMAAGQLIEEVSGETWEKYIHDHVFAPLAMSHSTDTRRRVSGQSQPRASAQPQRLARSTGWARRPRSTRTRPSPRTRRRRAGLRSAPTTWAAGS